MQTQQLELYQFMLIALRWCDMEEEVDNIVNYTIELIQGITYTTDVHDLINTEE